MGCIISSRKKISPVPSGLLASTSLFRKEVIRVACRSVDICISDSSLFIASSPNEISTILLRYLQCSDAARSSTSPPQSTPQSSPSLDICAFRLFSDVFYKNLMDRDPLYRKIFQSSQDRQLKTMGVMLTWILSRTQTREDKISQLMEIPTRFSSWMPDSSHMFNVMDAFQHSMRTLLGKRLTPNMEHAWREIFTNIIFLLSCTERKHLEYDCFKMESASSSQKDLRRHEKTKCHDDGEQHSVVLHVPNVWQRLACSYPAKTCSPVEATVHSLKSCSSGQNPDHEESDVEKHIKSGSSHENSEKTAAKRSAVASGESASKLRTPNTSKSQSPTVPLPLGRISVSSTSLGALTRKDSASHCTPLHQSIYHNTDDITKRGGAKTPVSANQVMCPCQLSSPRNASIFPPVEHFIYQDCLCGVNSPSELVDFFEFRKFAWTKRTIDPRLDNAQVKSSKCFPVAPNSCTDDEGRTRKKIAPFSLSSCSTLRTDPTELQGTLENSRASPSFCTPRITLDSNPGLPVAVSLPGIVSPLSSLGGLEEDPVASNVHNFRDSNFMHQLDVALMLYRGLANRKYGKEVQTPQPSTFEAVANEPKSPASHNNVPATTLSNAHEGSSSTDKFGSNLTRDQCDIDGDEETDDEGDEAKDDTLCRQTLALSMSTDDTIPFVEPVTTHRIPSEQLLSTDFHNPIATSWYTMFPNHTDMVTADSLLEPISYYPHRSDTSTGTHLSTFPSMPSPFLYLSQVTRDFLSGIVQTNDNASLRKQSPTWATSESRDKHIRVPSVLYSTPIYSKDYRLPPTRQSLLASQGNNALVTPDALPHTPKLQTHSLSVADPQLCKNCCDKQWQLQRDNCHCSSEIANYANEPKRIDTRANEESHCASTLGVKAHTSKESSLQIAVSTSENFASEDALECIGNSKVASLIEQKSDIDPFRIKGGILHTMRTLRDAHFIPVPRL